MASGIDVGLLGTQGVSDSLTGRIGAILLVQTRALKIGGRRAGLISDPGASAVLLSGCILGMALHHGRVSDVGIDVTAL